MRNNIRRSLAVAAAAFGIWALSTAGASAAQLPMPTDADSTVSGTVEKAQDAGDAGKGSVAGALRGATGTAQKTAGGVECHAGGR